MDWTFVVDAVDRHIREKRFDRAADLLHQILPRDPDNPALKERAGLLKSLERRRARRLPVELVVFLVRRGDADAFPARIIEASRIGLHLLCPEEIRKGDRLTIQIPSRISLEDLLVLPCVGVWCRPEGGRYRVGLEIGDLTRDQQMMLLERTLEGLFRSGDPA